MNKIGKITGWIALMGGLLLGVSMIAFPASVTQLAGLAVAQTAGKWNVLKDMAAGDAQTSGAGLMTPCLWNGTSCDRQRGSIANGAFVDVKAFAGNVTPADAAANPSTSIYVYGLNGLFNGSTWDRWRGTITGGALVTQAPSGTAFFSVKRDNIAGSSVNLAFGFTSKKISVRTDPSNTDELCIDWIGGTAVCPAANTAGDGRLSPGTTLILDDYAITSVSFIAASGTQVVFVNAWN